MSHQATTWALNVGSEAGEKGVGDTARKFLLVAMADHAHKDGRNSFCKRETLAEYLECDVRSIGRYQRRLIADGFIRRGDQSIVSGRGDRRPVVYDLAMTEATRARWAAAAKAGDSSWDAEQAALQHTGAAAGAPEARQDNLSPRPQGHDETHVSPRDDPDAPPAPPATGGRTAGHTGGQTAGQEPGHGGTSVSHRTHEPDEPLPPHPPASGGSAASTPSCASCRGLRPCRSCGTTPRQLEAAARKAAAAEKRAADRVADEQARRDRDAQAASPEAKKRHTDEARQLIRRTA
ncbi:helix-turn-helix domain-containing protein [Nocardioides marmoraquaticus]